jgi:hypothetical protein
VGHGGNRARDRDVAGRVGLSENPTWSASLARTSNMEPIDSLPYAFSFTPIFNRPGSFSMGMPLDDDIAYQVVKHSTCVVCERNEATKWSGSIVNVVKDPASMTLTMTAVGWLDGLNQRYLWAEDEPLTSFVNVPSGAIITALIEIVNSHRNSAGSLMPTPFRTFSVNDTQLRTRTYKRGQSVGQAIQELVDIENGVDVYVNPSTRAITTQPPTAFADRVNVLFGYGSEPHNLANAPQTDDGSSTAEYITTVGANGVAVAADAPDLIVAHGGFVREDWVALSDVNDPGIIGAYGNSELVYRGNGQVTYDLKPLSYGDVPRLYDDFELGDKVYLSVSAGAQQVERQALRVFSVGIEVDANGNEVVNQIVVTPQ